MVLLKFEIGFAHSDWQEEQELTMVRQLSSSQDALVGFVDYYKAGNWVLQGCEACG